MRRRLFAALAVACVIAFTPDVARSSPRLIQAVKADIGTNPTGWERLWCAKYLRMVLKELGYHEAYKKTDNRAKSFLKLKRALHAKPGVIAVMGRKGGGHSCVVTRVMQRTFECVGGNQGAKRRDGTRRVSKNIYPISRVIAFVTP